MVGVIVENLEILNNDHVTINFLKDHELDCLRVEHQCRMMELGFMQSIIVEIVCEMGDLILCKHVPNVVKEIEKRGLRYSEGH